MDHVAVREWLDEAFFAPDALESDDASSQAARAHIVECPECAAHAQALRRTALKLDLARGPSAEVRERVLETARRIGRSRQPAPVRQPWWRGGLAWQLAATVLVVGVLGVSVGAWWGGATRPESVEARRLADAVAMMADLSGQPGTRELVLRDATGAAAGVALVSPTSHQVALFTDALPRLSQGGYGCYFERAGQRTWIGPMQSAEGVQFWAGDMADSIEMTAGDKLVVAEDASAPSMLSASF